VGSSPTAATCAAVDERDDYCCVRCGRWIDGGSRHHRQLRRFGDHSTANLILLCGSGTTGCHGWVHAHPKISYENGWLVHGWHESAAVPLLTYGGRWRLLNSEGSYSHMTPTQARERLEELGVLS